MWTVFFSRLPLWQAHAKTHIEAGYAPPPRATPTAGSVVGSEVGGVEEDAGSIIDLFSGDFSGEIC